MRKELSENPDKEIKMKDYSEVARMNVQMIDDHLNKSLKQDKGKRGK